MVFASAVWESALIVPDFFSDTGICVSDMASPILEIGSTVAYERLAIENWKRGRLQARRRDVEDLRAAMLKNLIDTSNRVRYFQGVNYHRSLEFCI